jgi:AcrR family transcriptional regulator
MVTDEHRAPTRRTPRRAPRPEERGKAAERTRERILQAAVEEFGAKGYSGARTAGIAARAGVNQQLISYYFGGKQGLLDELRRRWASLETTLVPAGASFIDAVTAYLDATLDRPDWARLVIWQALGDSPGGHDQQQLQAAQASRLHEAVERVRRRQRAGEITPDLDPEFILLLAYALTFAPIALPRVVEGIMGADPGSREYRRRCRDQLSKLVRPPGATS